MLNYLLGILGKHEEAIAAHQEAINISPQYSFALANQCATLNRLGQNVPDSATAKENYQLALASCQKSLQEGDNQWGKNGSAYAWNQQANALTGLMRYEEALATNNRAIAIQSQYTDAWSSRAKILWHLGRFAEALTKTQYAIDINPQSSLAWFNRGTILTTQGQYQLAVDTYNKALEGDASLGNRPILADIWTNQSAAFWHLGLYSDAIEAAQKALPAFLTKSGKREHKIG